MNSHLERGELISEPRTAVVTGGAKGIGAAIAKRLALDGFKIGVLDLEVEAGQRTVDEILRLGAEGVAVHCDVSNEDSVGHAVETVAEALGAPTVLVNNAGVTRDNLLYKMDADDWDTVIDVHLRGAYLMTRKVAIYMTERKWGRVVNLSSTSALGNRGQANYAAAKAGIQGFTKTMAIELGKYGVTVNAIAPGFIETDMTAATAKRLGIPFDEFIRAGAASIPVGRVGQPEDVAAVASFFASDDAAFVSGQVIYVAGGPRS
jgi:3-oxoacyl-[acyl-carrier protein] reductase